MDTLHSTVAENGEVNGATLSGKEVSYERRASRIEAEAIISRKKATRRRTQRVRSQNKRDASRIRRDKRRAKWDAFLMDPKNDDKRYKEVGLSISDYSSELESNAPEKLEEELAALRAQLHAYISGSVFKEELQDADVDKVQEVKSAALEGWRAIKTSTAVIDKSPKEKANALQDTNKQLQIERQRNIRRLKKHKRLQRMQIRIRETKALLVRLKEKIQDDAALKAGLKPLSAE